MDVHRRLRVSHEANIDSSLEGMNVHWRLLTAKVLAR
jgi:hypothetical protein